MERIFRYNFLVVGFLAFAVLMQVVTSTKFDQLRSGQLLSSKDVVSIKERERQLSCLAANIYHEAGSEPFEGKVAVAQVTMNRVASPEFPNDVCAVIYQKNIIYEKVVCQFSWYCEGHGKNKPIRSQEAYDESMEVAKKVLLEGFKLDVLKTALYYHADYVNPRWKKEKIGKIGRHIFYRKT